MILFLLFCRSNRGLYDFLTLCSVALYGPFICYWNTDSIFFNWIAVHFLPSWVLCLTSNRKCFICQVFLEIIFMQTLYKPQMLEMISRTNTFEYINRLSNITCLSIVIHSVCTITIDHSLHKIYNNQILISERKKEELERQKLFLLSFSHELRNHINTMTGNIQLSLLEKISPKVESLLHNSEICAQLLLHLINNILDSGKMEIGELEINPVPTMIYNTIEKVWTICSQLIRAKNLNGQMRIQSRIPANLKIDHYRLTQIFLNLVGNAVKFTDLGAIYVDIEWTNNSDLVDESSFKPYPFDDEGLFEKKRSLRVLQQSFIIMNTNTTSLKRGTFEDSERPGILKITVSDTGCGVSPHLIPTLFQKFTQATKNPSDNRLGTGLGLFITKEICQRMNGDIKVYSKLGKGSSFIVCIPVEPSLTKQRSFVSISSFKESMLQKPLKVMIVDDVEFNTIILSNYFEHLGLKVLDTAGNGEDAFIKYKERFFNGMPLDVVTMDVEMPIMDGKRSARLIREFELQNKMRPCLMVMISANCSDSEIKECINKDGDVKADFFLKKPVTIDEVFKVLQSR